MTQTQAERPTDRQHAYMARLETELGADVFGQIAGALGVGDDLTKREASALIGACALRAGHVRPAAKPAPRRRTWARCSHEDYPCCGCDADSRGAYGSSEPF